MNPVKRDVVIVGILKMEMFAADRNRSGLSYFSGTFKIDAQKRILCPQNSLSFWRRKI